MKIIATKNETKEFQKVAPGTYYARCYRVIDLGHQTVEYNNDRKVVHQVMLTWELPTEKAVFDEAKGEEPFAISKTYTLSLHEKSNLRTDLESWRGKAFTEKEARAFDLVKLLGKPCLLSVAHKQKKDGSGTYAFVSSIAPLMKGQECPPQINPTKVLAWDEFNWDLFESLSDYTKDKIKASEEFKRLQEPPVLVRDEETGNDEINDYQPDLPGYNSEEDDLPF